MTATTLDIPAPPSSAAPAVDPPSPRPRSLGSRLWFWVTGPGLALLTVAVALLAENTWYLTARRQAPDLLVTDLIVISALCLITRFRWPALSFAVAAIVPLALAAHHGLDGPTEGVMIVCLISLAWRCSSGPILVATVASGAVLEAATRWDVIQTTTFADVVRIVAIPLAIALVLRGIRAGVRRLGKRPPSTHPPVTSATGIISVRQVAAVLVVGLAGQGGLLWYSTTFWPVHTSATRFTASLCGEFQTWNRHITADVHALDRAQAHHITVARRRTLHATMITELTAQTSELADHLEGVARSYPARSTAAHLATALATDTRRTATTLRSLIRPWAALPTTSRRSFDDAQRPLLLRFDLAGIDQSYRAQSTILVALSRPGTPRALTHELHATPGCPTLLDAA